MEIMFRRLAVSFALVTACACTAFTAGCNEGPTASTAPSATTRLSPEASFEQIAQIVREGLEMPGGSSIMVTQKDGSSSRFQVHNSITSNVMPPTKADEPYRATLTVTSRSVYSLRKIEEEPGDEETSPQGGFSMLDDERGDGFEVMDQELVSGGRTDAKTGGQEIEKVQRHSDEEVRNFDFNYENNRWVLKSKLDPEARGQAAIAGAIDRALKLQP